MQHAIPCYYPNQQMHNIYINNILYTVSTPMCFSASASSSGSLSLVLAKVKKLLKLQLNKISRLKCSRDRCWVILILVSWNFNYFVTSAKHKVKTPWRWRRCCSKGPLFSWRWTSCCPNHVETEVNNKHLIVASCWFFCLHTARSQEPKAYNSFFSEISLTCHCLLKQQIYITFLTEVGIPFWRFS